MRRSNPASESLSPYEQAIARGLDKALQSKTTADAVMAVDEIKLVVFSDQHKGQRDGADDFLPCRPAYHAALGYYREAGFMLVLLGDVEELWECRPRDVVRAYADTLALEASFVGGAGCARIAGNHDPEWCDPRRVTEYLREFYPGDHPPDPAGDSFVLEVVSNGESLGRIFFVHGHQGTADSDSCAGISRFFVRRFWRPFQRLLRIRSTTPSRDFELRRAHEVAMYRWAERQPSLILIAGHTHHPVFSTETHERFLQNEIAAKRKELESAGEGDRKARVRADVSDLQARLEWVLSKSNGIQTALPRESKPCYFNSGCCSFADGDITAIEIEDGVIRLVRWPDDHGRPKKKILRVGSLRDILRRCR